MIFEMLLLPLWHVYQGYINFALYLPLYRPSRLGLGSNGRQGYRYKNGDTKKPHIFSIELNNKCLMIVVLYISNIILKTDKITIR